MATKKSGKAPAPPVGERELVLTGEPLAFVRGGGRDVDIAKLTFDPPLIAGQHLRLFDDRGDDVGLGIGDPDNELIRVLAVPADRFPKLDGALIGWRVERAMALRRAMGLVGPDAAYRLIHGAGDALPGFTCDVLGKVAVLYAYAAALVPMARVLAEAVRGFAGVDGVVIKVRARGGADTVAQEVVGTVAERVVAFEDGVPFEIHPLGGLNAGLFTDMREHRRALPRLVAGKSVLNLFSYTGALSLACARAGATSVTSVDTSAGVHEWAKNNFRASNLEPGDRWRFETGDAVRFLARALRDKERYEVVMIDPPTFSTARGTPWTLDRDYPELIAAAAAVIPDSGLLWLAANTHGLGSLLRLAHAGLRKANRVGAIIDQGGLPPDYPTLAAQPRDRYLQVGVFRLIG